MRSPVSVFERHVYQIISIAAVIFFVDGYSFIGDSIGSAADQSSVFVITSQAFPHSLGRISISGFEKMSGSRFESRYEIPERKQKKEEKSIRRSDLAVPPKSDRPLTRNDFRDPKRKFPRPSLEVPSGKRIFCWSRLLGRLEETFPDFRLATAPPPDTTSRFYRKADPEFSRPSLPPTCLAAPGKGFIG